MKPNSLESQLKKALEEELLYSALSDELESQILEESYTEEEIDDEEDDEEYEYEEDDEYEDDDAEDRATVNSNQKEKKKKSKLEKRRKTVKRLKNELKFKSVVLVVLTLLVNTYAWFIYNAMVSTKIQMHIKGWSFDIENMSDEEFIFKAEEVYPGMKGTEKTVNAQNKGETKTSLRCEFQYVRVFNDVYSVGDAIIDENGNATGDIYTSEILYDLLNSYPFNTDIHFGNAEYDGNPIVMDPGESRQIKFSINWPYELEGANENVIAEQDAIDTEWGEKAYDFKNTAGNNEYCVEIKLKIVAQQVDE